MLIIIDVYEESSNLQYLVSTYAVLEPAVFGSKGFLAMVPKSRCILICVLLFVAWNVIVILLLMGKSPGYEGGPFFATSKDSENGDILKELLRLMNDFETALESQNKILLQIDRHKSLWGQRKGNSTGVKRIPNAKVPNDRIQERSDTEESSSVIIPILVMACNRVTVQRCLDKLLEYRPSAELYPIIVSQDCGHAETASVITSYGSKVTHIKQPDLSDISVPESHKKFQGYYKISRHYRWALNQVFNSFSYSTVIIVEDDLEVAPDFFEYFKAVYPILKSDPSLWCVSAWNDNGRDGFVDPGKPSLLHRTDFFPGLGWMLLKDVWLELEPKWPASFWDDWMRHPDQRKDRSCVRPEISRTLTFGRKGVSLGQFYDKYLRFIKLNIEFVPFTKINLTYLEKTQYDKAFEEEVYSAPAVTMEDLKNGKLSGPGPFRLQYSSAAEFKVSARKLGVMDDLKSGVPRAGYRGVVSIFVQGKRLYIAPPAGWTHYDSSWS